MILYGISTCDTCKKAQKALVAAGHAVTFRDVRANPLSEAEIAEFVAEFGPAIVNRQSTTWRGLSAFLRESEPEAQLAAQPTLMKRPVIRGPGGLTLGWSDEVAARHGAGG
ncbi:MAG: arsenate reductase family protein [Gemmobacter sp.]|uniref:arsenate reductase family protein n=1 Tax=Gemmobacter sp. TaxID=1898957 RepID=UPI00391B3937